MGNTGLEWYETACWHVHPDSQGNGVSCQQEDCSQGSCFKKLHVSNNYLLYTCLEGKIWCSNDLMKIVSAMPFYYCANSSPDDRIEKAEKNPAMTGPTGLVLMALWLCLGILIQLEF